MSEIQSINGISTSYATRTSSASSTKDSDTKVFFAAILEQLKTAADLEWTCLSPSAMFVPGERTGKFRLGKDTLLSNENGSSISFEDYAIAFADELEKPAHIRQRFTVGY